MAAAGRGPGLISTSTQLPGEPTKGTTSLVESGTGLIQGFTPLQKIHEHLCAFHFYAYDMTRQTEAYHFCSHINEDVRQCLLYDSPDKDARLIGVEYMISEKLFLNLPDEEKKLWHSHEYEVKSGVLFMPGVPLPIQRKAMEKVSKTYGKVFHFWQYDKGDTLPLGLPQLMTSLTADGQLYEELAQDVQKRYDYSFEEERAKRQYISGPDHGIHPLANYWTSGRGIQTHLSQTDSHPNPTIN